MTNRLNNINASLDKLATAERITKKELSFLSRELLTYVMIDAGENDKGKERDLGDIDAVNRTLAVLTPMNKRTAVLFFTEFLPFSFDEGTCAFGKMNKKQKKAALERLTKWLADEDNDIWKWAADNIKVEKKEIDYSKLIADTIKKAMAEDKGGLSAKDVMNAILDSDLTMADIMQTVAEVKDAIDTQGEDQAE